MRAVRYLLLFTAFFMAAPVSAQPLQVEPGRLTTAVIPEVLARTLFNGADGFFLEVPAEAVLVEITLTTAPPEANLDLFVRFGDDVDRAPSGDIISDFQSMSSGGAESIAIAQPVLQPGTYFIAIEAGFRNPQTFAFLQAHIELTPGAQNLDALASTDFEVGNAQGWGRNFPTPMLAVPGATTGDADATVEVRRGPLDFSRNLQLTSAGNDYFVAPAEYLGKLALLGTNARLELDLAFDGDRLAQSGAEVRIMNGRSTFRWVGDKPKRRMIRYIVSLDPGRWERLSGGDTFEEALDNVLRIEIRANFGSEGVTFLDNVVLLGKAVPPGAPAISTFETGLEGWRPNFPAAPFLISRAIGVTQGDFRTATTGVVKLDTAGNPGGFLQVRDIDDFNRDYMVAPDRFLGNLLELGSEARLEFDRKHESPAGPNRGVELRLIGFGGVYAWVGSPPGRDWTHYTVPLRAENWVLLAGNRSFAEILRAVQRLEISMDELTGREDSGLDNFALIVPAPVTPELSVAPGSFRFSAVQFGPMPAPKQLELTSNGPLIEWVAARSSGAPWIEPSPGSGATPGTLAVTVNPTGLAVGVHRGFVEIAWIGSTRTIAIPVVLNIVSPTGPLLSDGGVVNSATFQPNSAPGGEIAGGMYISIFGTRLASRLAQAATIPLPNELAGTTVTIGGIPAALVFVSPGEIVGIAPQGLTQAPAGTGQGLTAADVIVIHNNEPSPAERIRLTPIRPKLFSQNQSGSGPGAILNSISSSTVQLNTFDDPARRTQTVLLFGTGFGPTQIPILDGFAATAANPVSGAVRVTIGGATAPVLFAGLGVQFPHLYQVNVTIPAGAPTGCEVPVIVAVDGIESNEVSMSISGNGEPCR